VRLAYLQEHVWQPVLAAEDHRFFAHRGVDTRSLARAVLANLRLGGVAQGGSTLTQQLVKNRDLTPRRTVGRKVSEALRALDVDASHSKQEILEVYLNHVYLGQVDGLAVHGFGAAAVAFFGKPAETLQVQEAAMLAGLIRSPNRLSPLRHPAEAKARRWQLGAALECLRRHLPPTTPTVFGRAVGRADETIAVTTLQSADASAADMATLVIIGSAETRVVPRPGHAPLVYTPRSALA